MVYGSALTLHGQFLVAQELPAEVFVKKLQVAVAISGIQPLSTRPPQE
jgi:hypothetical protein